MKFDLFTLSLFNCFTGFNSTNLRQARAPFFHPRTGRATDLVLMEGPSLVNAEFMRITTMPLQTKFMAQLDRYSADLTKLFSKRGGTAGKKIRRIMERTPQCDDINSRQERVLRSLCVYLNEDDETLIKEYMNRNLEEADRESATMGLHVVRKEGADAGEEPEHVGVVIEGVELLSNLGSVSFGFSMLFGLIYCLNMSYPQGLKFTFEFLQKVLMNLDGNNLSPKVQALKIKMLQ
ncbi:uncharacterized protein LOC130211094 isoform X1 [Pseudoliparis swirei]|uniref:uncharacterized protein LOC130211094 isoform X1 n=2 Tax=Pseudoliparis swirei TaxID=2059687 RepID=UPI0024BDF46F|nr:uncharacterized protein LOC130211094 isoform X1 [Pseudoliparis swirei]